jgi:hypothetical protein
VISSLRHHFTIICSLCTFCLQNGQSDGLQSDNLQNEKVKRVICVMMPRRSNKRM